MSHLVTPTGLNTNAVPPLRVAIQRVLELLYQDTPHSSIPITHKHHALTQRNAAICARHTAGDTLNEIAEQFGISIQRVHQIIKRWC